MSELRESGELAQLFGPLAQNLRDARTTAEIYQLVVEAAVRVIPGCDHASVLVLEKGQFRTVAASDEVAALMEILERETGQGPCLDAIIGDSFQHDTDIIGNSTWSELTARCLAETPVRGIIASRLADDGRRSGALNLFSDTAGALDHEAVDQAAVLAAFTSVAVAAAFERERADNLKVALDSNREIGKAIGLLMASHNLTDEQAFGVLKRASQDLNRKLHDIATEFVTRESDATETR